MLRKRQVSLVWLVGLVAIFGWISAAQSQSPDFRENIYQVGKLKPRDSVPKLKVGERAPDFTLSSVRRGKISLLQYRGKKNVVISFVPAAWTPVCSDQWPGYNIAKDFFDQNDAILLGISVDNIPTLHSWTKQMCVGKSTLWFPVLSDFYPHGAVADKYGVLRSDGVSERAIFVVDKKGIIRYIDVHDINTRPRLEVLVRELEKVNK